MTTSTAKQNQESDASKQLMELVDAGVIQYPSHSSIPPSIAELKQHMKDHQETLFLGRVILTETVFVLSLNVYLEAQSASNPETKAKSVEKAKNLIRDEVTNVTKGLDGLSSSDIHPGLWEMATQLLG